jgi:SAM-dependent methyltransferase
MIRRVAYWPNRCRGSVGRFVRDSFLTVDQGGRLRRTLVTAGAQSSVTALTAFAPAGKDAEKVSGRSMSTAVAENALEVAVDDSAATESSSMAFKPIVVDKSEIKHEDEDIIGPRLMQLSRTNYKKLEDLPQWLEDKRKIVGLMRTNNQKKMCAEEMLKVMPSHNYDMQLKYRNKPLGWNYNKYDVAKAPIQYGPPEAVVYTDLFMPSRYLITKRVLKELKDFLPSFRPKRVLDFGCGPATAYAAILETFGGKTTEQGMRKYTGVDCSQAMLDAAKVITQGGPVDCVFFNKSADVFQLAKNRGERYDLIVLSYTLSEMANDSMRAATVQLMTELLNVGGNLVIIEAGGPHGSHAVRTARQFVLDVFNIPLNGNNNKGATKSKSNKKSEESKDNDSQNTGLGQLQYYNGADEIAKKAKENAPTKTYFALPPPEIDPKIIATNHNSRFGQFDFGVKIISPCTHDGLCPLGEGIWCSFALKVGSLSIDSVYFSSCI